MEKIELTKREKEIILELMNDSYDINKSTCDIKELKHLSFLGLGKGIESEFGSYFDFDLTDVARSYLFENPKLKNPSIWDDKKFWMGFVTDCCSLLS